MANNGGNSAAPAVKRMLLIDPSEPLREYSSRLDREMQRILANRQMGEDEKLKRYLVVLRRYVLSKHQVVSNSSMPTMHMVRNLATPEVSTDSAALQQQLHHEKEIDEEEEEEEFESKLPHLPETQSMLHPLLRRGKTRSEIYSSIPHPLLQRTITDPIMEYAETMPVKQMITPVKQDDNTCQTDDNACQTSDNTCETDDNACKTSDNISKNN